MSTSDWRLGALAESLGVELRGDPKRRITGLQTLRDAGPESLSFLANTRYTEALRRSCAGAVLLRSSDLPLWSGDALLTEDPYAVYARASHLFDRQPVRPPGCHASAVIAADALIGTGVHIGPLVVIGAGAVIADACIIEAGCVIGENCRLGPAVHLAPRVVLYPEVHLGARVRIQSGSVLGGDGFGFAHEGGRWQRIAQLGRVVVGDDVDIGANTCIDRGALGDTVLEEGVIIDNQVQIAHNVHIGAHTAIAACVGISGSTRIGRHCVLAGGVGLVGHIEICDAVHITGMTMITKSIHTPGSYSSGTAFESSRQWKKTAVRLRQLESMAERLRRLEAQVSELQTPACK